MPQGFLRDVPRTIVGLIWPSVEFRRRRCVGGLEVVEDRELGLVMAVAVETHDGRQLAER
jgi:hypothetical protein